VDLRERDADRAFRAEVRSFLEESLTGEFAGARGRGGPGDEHAMYDVRLAWERHLGHHGWTGVGWPKEHGGRGLSLHQQVIFHEEYARAHAPGRVGHVGETLLGPTLIAYARDEQRRRFLPPILRGEELWCQGYSEPGAGSDLASLSTRARLEGDEWVIDGQKVWTSLAHWAQWCFVLARTDPDAPKHAGISYLLVPMDQPGIEVRPIHQMTGDSEFSEVFFTGARTAVDNVVGGLHEGWKVAMGTLAFERGASTLGQQLHFAGQLDEIVTRARVAGALDDPVVRQRIVDAWIRLQLMRWTALRTLGGDGPDEQTVLPRAAMVTKLFWATLHRDMGELAMDVEGAAAMLRGDGALTGDWSKRQRLFLFSRADTIYAGTNEVQRNIIGERALELPR
jgi:alkylation response protein AidB-like acyl-CoA dehydrogenase